MSRWLDPIINERPEFCKTAVIRALEASKACVHSAARVLCTTPTRLQAFMDANGIRVRPLDKSGVAV